MSRGVDVLAVMEGAAVYLSTSGWTPSPSMEAEFSEARAAFAELIEADIAYDEAMKKRHSRAYLDCAQIKQRRIQQRLTDACHRRNKALARVRGAA